MWDFLELFIGHFRRKRCQANGDFPAQTCRGLWPESWLVARCRNLLAVQTALGLRQTRPCRWVEGLSSAEPFFVAPPVKGWILVTGTGLPSPAEDVDACFRFVLELSLRLGQVQFFSAQRTSRCHAWVKVRNGGVVRAYAWAGVTLWQQGPITPEEAELGVTCFEYAEPAAEAPFPAGEVVDTNVKKVPILAAHWGLAPTSVLEHFPLDEVGITGKVSHRN